MNRKKPTRWAAMAGTIAMAAGALVAGQLAGATPASAVTGLEKVQSLVRAPDINALNAATATASTVPIGGVTVASTISPFNSANKTFQATCPAGKRVLGGGGFVSGTRHAVLTELRPITTAGADSYQVSAAEDEVGEVSTWAILAYAFCANPLPGLEIVTATSTAASNAFTGLSARCPTLKYLVGSGGRIDGGSGQVDLLTLLEGSFSPSRSTAGGQEDRTGFAGNWTVTSYAVCVPSNNLQVVKTYSTGDSTTFKAVTATCPSGMQATGGAGWADTPAHVSYIKPDKARSPSSIEVGATAATPFTGTVIAIALCAS